MQNSPLVTCAALVQLSSNARLTTDVADDNLDSAVICADLWLIPWHAHAFPGYAPGIGRAGYTVCCVWSDTALAFVVACPSPDCALLSMPAIIALALLVYEPCVVDTEVAVTGRWSNTPVLTA